MAKKKEFSMDTLAQDQSEIGAANVDGLTSQDTSKLDTGNQELTKEKLVIPLMPDGSIDLSSVREKTRSKILKAVTSTPGLIPVSSEPASIPDAAVDAIYSIVGGIETMIFSRKYPKDLCETVFSYSRDELQLLRDPTKAVLAKHANKLMRHQEETTLMLVLVQVHFDKMHVLRELASKHAQTQPQQKQAS